MVRYLPASTAIGCIRCYATMIAKPIAFLQKSIIINCDRDDDEEPSMNDGDINDDDATAQVSLECTKGRRVDM